MPTACTVTLDHLGGCLANKETEVATLKAGALADFAFTYNTDKTEVTAITVNGEVEDNGLVEFTFEGENLDFIEEGVHDDDGKNTWTDSTEGLLLYSASTADDTLIRNLLGKEIFFASELSGKDADSLYQIRLVGVGGRFKVRNVRRSVSGQNWELTVSGSSRIRQVYFNAGTSADGNASALEALVRD